MAAPAHLPTELLHQNVLLAQGGDAAARDRVVRATLWVVDHWVRRARCPTCDVDDLRQDALLGLLYAIGRWSPDHGSKFLSWATLCVRGYIRNNAKYARKRLARSVLVDDFDEGVGFDGWTEADLDSPAVRSREVERLTLLAEQIPTERHRQIIRGRLAGLTTREIAAARSVEFWVRTRRHGYEAAENVIRTQENRAWLAFLRVARADLGDSAREELAENLRRIH